MKPSEKLLVLLELNGFDISDIRIKKQLEYEENGNVDIYRYYNYTDIITHHYEFEQNQDVLNQNPLNYHDSWKKKAKSIDQFYIKHPEVGDGVTLKELINAKQVDASDRERVINDVIETWIDESRTLQDTKIQALSDVVGVINQDNMVFRKPSRFLLFIAIVFALATAVISVVPLFFDVTTYTDSIPYVSDYIDLASTTSWFMYLGFGATGFLLLYVILNIWYRLVLKKKTNGGTEKLFDKLDRDIKYQQFLQSKAFNEYVKLVIKKPHKSSLKVKSLLAPNELVDEIKQKVVKIVRKFDVMSRRYHRNMAFLKWVFILGLLAFIGFGGIGYGVIGGYLNV